MHKGIDVVGDNVTSIMEQVKVLQDQYRRTKPDTRFDEE